MKIRLAAYLQSDSIVDGEGIRTVIWTQGCPHHCLGCHNPETWSFDDGELVDLEDVYQTLNILNIRLRRFLTNLQMAFLSNDWNLADELIRKQEIDLKTRSRAKLCHTEDYDPSVWIGGGYLDYRFFSARRIISDIYGAEGEYSV